MSDILFTEDIVADDVSEKTDCFIISGSEKSCFSISNKQNKCFEIKSKEFDEKEAEEENPEQFDLSVFGITKITDIKVQGNNYIYLIGVVTQVSNPQGITALIRLSFRGGTRGGILRLNSDMLVYNLEGLLDGNSPLDFKLKSNSSSFFEEYISVIYTDLRDNKTTSVSLFFDSALGFIRENITFPDYVVKYLDNFIDSTRCWISNTSNNKMIVKDMLTGDNAETDIPVFSAEDMKETDIFAMQKFSTMQEKNITISDYTIVTDVAHVNPGWMNITNTGEEHPHCFPNFLIHKRETCARVIPINPTLGEYAELSKIYSPFSYGFYKQKLYYVDHDKNFLEIRRGESPSGNERCFLILGSVSIGDYNNDIGDWRVINYDTDNTADTFITTIFTGYSIYFKLNSIENYAPIIKQKKIYDMDALTQ